jgi:hypothetical protein
MGAASLLSQARTQWHGTLVFVGQPAEEVLQGAELMIKDLQRSSATSPLNSPRGRKIHVIADNLSAHKHPA